MNSKKKIGLIGYLGYSIENPIIGGQMTKTRGIYQELKRKYGNDNIEIIDTSNWKSEKISIVFAMLRIAMKCDPIIIMPNKNGIKIILPFFSMLKSLYNYSIAYPVVGGWLTNSLKKHIYLCKAIKKVDYILPETKQLQKELLEFTDVKIDVMPIFSTRIPVNKEQINVQWDGIKKFCIFSRITPEKGIDEAIKALRIINKNAIIAHLDIWGPIDHDYEEHYMKLFANYNEFVTYKGVLSLNDSLQELSEYYMMLFPTYYPGEGFPTTICESFMAGLPVIASDWRFNRELITDGENGFLIPVHDINMLSEKILLCINNKEMIITMKYKALKYSKKFKPELVMSELFTWINYIKKA